MISSSALHYQQASYGAIPRRGIKSHSRKNNGPIPCALGEATSSLSGSLSSRLPQVKGDQNDN